MHSTEYPQNWTQGDILMVIIHSKFSKNPSITFQVIYLDSVWTDRHTHARGENKPPSTSLTEVHVITKYYVYFFLYFQYYKQMNMSFGDVNVHDSSFNLCQLITIIDMYANIMRALKSYLRVVKRFYNCQNHHKETKPIFINISFQEQPSPVTVSLCLKSIEQIIKVSP